MQHGTPPAEVTLDTTQAHALLAQQHPDLAHLTIAVLDAGFDNFMFRLGDDYCLRFPRRRAAAALVLHEQQWLPHLAPHLPLPVPTPLRVGAPGLGYPWHWSVLPWLPGQPADLTPLHADEALLLVDFLKALHRCAQPSHAPHNPVRGCPLAARAGRARSHPSRMAARRPAPAQHPHPRRRLERHH